MPKKILFIGHAASRSGAPILLLQFLAWLKAHSDLTVDAMVVNDGPLLGDMRSVTSTEVIETWPSLPARAARKLVGRDRWARRQDKVFQQMIAKRGYDLA